jgi:hypothetical protein
VKSAAVAVLLPALALGQSGLVFRNVQVFDGARFVAPTNVLVEGSYPSPAFTPVY